MPNSPSFSRITDSILQMRQAKVELQAEVVEELVTAKVEETYQWFLSCVKAVLSWEQPALNTYQFEEIIDKLIDDTKNYFRTLFLQGTSGENVPFTHIEHNEQTLLHFCKSDLPLFRYCNLYKSFVICSNLKRDLIKEHSQGKSKVLKLYDRSAQGPYASRCREDLDQLLTLLIRCKSSQKEVESKLEAQLAMDQDILTTKRNKAQEKARTQLEGVFQSSPEGKVVESAATKSMLQSHASVLDFINRIGTLTESSSQSMVMSLAVGSLNESPKKQHTSEPRKREDSIDDLRSSPSACSSPPQGENTQRPRVLCMDWSALHKLEE